MFPESCRYPYFKPYNISMVTKYEKKYTILKATSQNLYIDDTIINLSPKTFKKLINDLVAEGMLCLNGYDDKYGLNMYDTTKEADEIVENSKRKAVNLIIERSSYAMGTAIAAYRNHSI